MSTPRRRAATAFTAAAALALGVLPAAFTTSAILAGGEEPTTLESGTNHGGPTLKLETNAGATDWVRLYNAGGTKVSEQQLVDGKKCELSTDGSLLQISGFVGNSTSNAASLYGDSIGVAEKPSGTSCAQVGSATSERLTLRLNPSLRGTTFPLEAVSARLDVELKQSARVLATASLNGPVSSGGTRVWTFDLQSGASIGSPRPADVPQGSYTLETECKTAADSGPDSKDGDNCLWDLAPGAGVYFDTLELVPTVGSFSLEGGSDFQNPNSARSVFNLAEIDDGDLCVGDRVTRDGSPTAPTVSVTRLGNADGSTAVCVPYRFTNGLQNAELLKPINQEVSAQFVFDFVWTVPADTTLGDPLDKGLVKRTDVDFDGTGSVDTPTVLSSCPDLKLATVEGVDYEVVEDITTNTAAPDLAPGYPGTGTADTKQFACIVSQSIDPILGTDNVEVTERIYAYGDIVLRKP